MNLTYIIILAVAAVVIAILAIAWAVKHKAAADRIAQNAQDLANRVKSNVIK